MNRQADDLTTNPSLLIRLRDVRDSQAWALFVEVYGPLIISYCQRKNLQDSDAADVSQEVLKTLCKALRGFEYQPERGRFRDWLGKSLIARSFTFGSGGSNRPPRVRPIPRKSMRRLKIQEAGTITFIASSCKPPCSVFVMSLKRVLGVSFFSCGSKTGRRKKWPHALGRVSAALMLPSRECSRDCAPKCLCSAMTCRSWIDFLLSALPNQSTRTSTKVSTFTG